jgi:hypothetical protein
MECSPIHLIYVIIFASVVYGFSTPEINVKLSKSRGIQFSLQGFSSFFYTTFLSYDDDGERGLRHFEICKLNLLN